MTYKILSRFIIFFVGLIISLPSYADRYKRVVLFEDDRNVLIPISLPKNKTVCQDYLKLLNYYARKNVPLSCERPIPPGWTNFTQPEWKELDLKEHEDLFERIGRFIFWDKRTGSPKGMTTKKQWQESIKEGIENKAMRLSQAKVDVDGDGLPETVIRYTHALTPCQPKRGKGGFGWRDIYHLVLDTNTSDSLKIIQLHNSASSDELFMYKGEVFLAAFITIAA